MKSIDQNLSNSPLPLRSPSPDLVTSNTIVQTKQITVSVSSAQKMPIIQQMKFLKSQNQRLKKILESKNSNEPIAQLKQKNRIIIDLRQKLQKSERWRVQISRNKSQNQLNTQNQLLQRIALLQQQNQELFQRLNSNRKCSVSYDGQLQDIRDYVIEQLKITTQKFKNKLTGRLDTVQNRLNNIQNFIDTQYNTRQSANKSDLSLSPSPIQSIRPTFQTQYPDDYQSLRKRLYDIQRQLKNQIQNYQLLQSDNLAIRSTLRQKQQLLIKLRTQVTNTNTSSPLKPNYTQLIQQNQALTDTANTLRRSYNQLLNKNSKLQDDLNYLTSQSSKNKTLLKIVQQQKGQLLNNQNTYQKQIFDLKQQIKQLLRQKLRPPLPTIIQPIEQLTQRQQQHQEYILLLEKQISQLHRQLKNVKSQNQQEQLDQVRQQLEGLNLQYERVLRYSEEIQLQLHTIKQQKKKSSQQYLNQLGNHYNVLLAEYNQMRDRNSGVEEVIIGLRNQNLRMQQQLNRKDKQLKILQQSIKISQYSESRDLKEEYQRFLRQIQKQVSLTKQVVLSISFQSVKQFIIQIVRNNEQMSKQLVEQLQTIQQTRYQLIVQQSQLQIKQQQIELLNNKIVDLGKAINTYTTPIIQTQSIIYENKEIYMKSDQQTQRDLKQLQLTNGEYKIKVGKIWQLTQKIQEGIMSVISHQ